MMDDCFPAAQSRPTAVKDAIGDFTDEQNEDRQHIWIDEKAKGTQSYQIVQQVPQGQMYGAFGNIKRHQWNKPTGTLKTPGIGMPPYLRNSGCHPLYNRTYSIREMARLASFPDAFRFEGRWEGADRIGNSVPPLLMRSIAWQIRAALFGGPPLVPFPRTMSYLEILDQAWQQHLAPREASAPTVISTFAGSGGSSLGYSMAGYRELLAVEWDQNAVDTFRLNFLDVPVWHGDIAKLSVEECLERAQVQPGELDVLDGSPPCQGFSTAGKREMSDPRNQLFREYVRLLRGLRPKVFVMENVSGMVKGKMKLIFADILRELKASGYLVSARLMNAMYFNVPQSRQRMIFVGVREDVGIAPTHPRGQGQPFGPSLENDVSPDLFLTAAQFQPIDAHRKRHEARGNGFGWQQVRPDKPSAAIVKNMLIVGANTRLVKVGARHRYLTNNEIKQIGSYPYLFQFIDRESMIECIGNSVPPLMMRSIAQHIREHILDA